MSFRMLDQHREEEVEVQRKNNGMTHREPGRVMRGALAVLLANLLVLMGIGSIVAVLVLRFYQREVLPSYLGWGLLAFPLALIVYLMCALDPRCRLCGQRLFQPRQCHRHERAHRSVLGYITTLALHVVVCRWFRCSLCGTKQKLK